jgi:hypothetical protein
VARRGGAGRRGEGTKGDGGAQGGEFPAERGERGIVRGTARPAVGMYAVLGGFYQVALAVGVALGLRARRGIERLLAGFILHRLRGVDFCGAGHGDRAHGLDDRG